MRILQIPLTLQTTNMLGRLHVHLRHEFQEIEKAVKYYFFARENQNFMGSRGRGSRGVRVYPTHNQTLSMIS